MTDSRVLAVDFGERRIGLALSDPGRIIASPLYTIDTRETANPVKAVAQAAMDNEARLLVVGYPLHLDGRAGEKARKVDGFVEQLRAELPGMKIVKYDERYSSAEATAILGSPGRKKKRRSHDKKAVDRVAAAVFLQEYLNAPQELAP